MKKNKIVISSERSYQHYPSWDVVYEWEDIFSKVLDCEVVDLYPPFLGKNLNFFRKIMRKMNLCQSFFKVSENKQWKIIWIMDAGIYKQYTFMNVIPIFLDFNINMVEQIMKATSQLPCWWVTNNEIYKELKKRNCRNVFFFPLSISDKYVSGNINSKTIDVIQFGRKNRKLHEYMLRICKKNPDIEYIYQISGKTLEYYSTKNGKIGKFDKREDYIKLIQKCKVSIVSSPGIDSSRDFGGIDFITPRFYESAAFYSHMIGRYTKNEEADLISLEEVCANISSYDEFENILMNMLEIDCNENITKYNDFLNKNKTSCRAIEMKEILEMLIE